MDPTAQRRREWLEAARLYLVTDTRSEPQALEQLLRAALQNGVDIVQLRDKQADSGAIVRAARIFRRLCDAYEALFIVNDSLELAIASAADGVHVGQDDRDVATVRGFVGEEMLIGVSTHSPEQIDAAQGGDYIAVGPIHATPTKPDYEPVGVELVRYAAGHATQPFFAIGGIDPGNVGEVARAGADRVAVVRAIRDSTDPGEAARQLRAGLSSVVRA